jgi:hypothetical protein
MTFVLWGSISALREAASFGLGFAEASLLPAIPGRVHYLPVYSYLPIVRNTKLLLRPYRNKSSPDNLVTRAREAFPLSLQYARHPLHCRACAPSMSPRIRLHLRISNSGWTSNFDKSTGRQPANQVHSQTRSYSDKKEVAKFHGKKGSDVCSCYCYREWRQLRPSRVVTSLATNMTLHGVYPINWPRDKMGVRAIWLILV